MWREFRSSRIWSNVCLREISNFVTGDVLNLSGGDDQDKEGDFYRHYFHKANSYAISNWGKGFRGASKPGELILDLEVELDPSLEYKFDFVFCHTVLEHVFFVQQAFKNLATLSRSKIFVVVPGMQMEHGVEDFGDYWRFTSGGLARLATEHGFKSHHVFSSCDQKSSIYHILVADREEKSEFVDHFRVRKANLGERVFETPFWIKAIVYMKRLCS